MREILFRGKRVDNFAPILNVVTPILSFMDTLSAVTDKIKQFIAALTGKSSYDKEWVYGNHLYDDMTGKHFIVPFGNISESTKLNEEGCCYCVGFEVIPETVGQYTGLTDKNGDKIFDGDIVNGKNEIHDYYEKFIVVWDDEAAGFYCNGCRNTDCNYCFDNVSDIKVIGNIHDNPELRRTKE